MNPYAKSFASAMLLATLLSATACSNMSDRQQRALSGGAIGAGVGTVGGLLIGGSPLAGAALGGAAGAAVGAYTDVGKSRR